MNGASQVRGYGLDHASILHQHNMLIADMTDRRCGTSGRSPQKWNFVFIRMDFGCLGPGAVRTKCALAPGPTEGKIKIYFRADSTVSGQQTILSPPIGSWWQLVHCAAGTFDRGNGGGFLTDHYPAATKVSGPYDTRQDSAGTCTCARACARPVLSTW